MKHYYTFTINIRKVFLAIILIIGIGVTLFLTLYYNNIHFSVIEVIAYVTGSTATMTLIYHALNLENQIFYQERNNEITKSKYTYDMVAYWNSPEISGIVQKTRIFLMESDISKELNENGNAKKFADFLDKNPEDRKSVVLILNYLETISTMVSTDDIDLDIIKNTFYTVFTTYYKKLSSYIDYRQTTGNPTIWSNFEELTTRWIRESKKFN